MTKTKSMDFFLKKNIKTLFLIIVICSLIYFFYDGYKKDREAKVRFYEEQYYGTIKKIHYYRAHRGFPTIEINRRIINFGISEEKVKNFIRVGDSIVKDSGTYVIKVFRLNNNTWTEKVFNTQFK